MAAVLSLPAELRQRIWRYLFQGVTAIHKPQDSDIADYSKERSLGSIFVVSRLISGEARAIFLEEARINIDNLFGSFRGEWSCPFIKPNLIRHAYWDFDDLVVDCSGALLEQLTNLKSLDFFGGSLGYHFHIDSVRDNRLNEGAVDFILSRPENMLPHYGIQAKMMKTLLEHQSVANKVLTVVCLFGILGTKPTHDYALDTGIQMVCRFSTLWITALTSCSLAT